MKHILTTLFLIFSTCISVGQIVNDDMAFFNYTYDKSIIKQNKVEKVTIETFLSDGRKTGTHIFYFDQAGVLTKESIIDTTNNLINEFLFFTNPRHDLVLRIDHDYELKSTDSVSYYKQYNGDKLIADSSSDMPIKYNFEYSRSGKLQKITISTIFGTGMNSRRVILNSFDSLNRMINIQETFYQNEKDDNGSQISNRDIFYNEKGRIEKEIEHVKNDGTFMTNKGSIFYGYDNQDNLSQIIRTAASSCVYEYNDKGLISKMRMSVPMGNEKVVTVDRFTYTYLQ